ncbi:MAG: FtsX-like permease family protein [Lachnospiraceae bacterium]
MKKNMLTKDFYMEIWKSKGRFLSIFFIVALGVSFFSGLRASEPDMRLSADAYYDADNLMDIQVISTMGLTEDDEAAIAEVEGIKIAEAGYSMDVLCELGDKEKVLHVMSSLETMNQITITEGRKPQKADECVMDAAFLEENEYQIGDEITFVSGTEDQITDTFSDPTFTIVGAGTTSYYVSFTRGSTTIGTGTVDGFAVVNPEAFDLEVYTEIYAEVEGAKEETVYTEEYDDKVEAVMDRIEDIVDERCEVRRADIVAEAQAELDDGRREYEEEKEKAENEIADAQKELDDGEAQIAQGKKEISDGWTQIENGRNELYSQQKTLSSKEQELQDGKAQYQSAAAQLTSAEQEFVTQSQAAEAQFAEKEQEIQTAQSGLDQLKAAYDAIVADPEASEEQMAQAQMMYAQWEAGTAELEDGKNQLAAARAELAAAKSELEAGRTQLNTQGNTISQAESQIASGKQQIAAAWAEIEKNEQLLNENQALLTEKEAELEEGKQEFAEKKQEAQEKLDEAKQELDDAEAEIQEIELPKWYVRDRSNLSDHTGFGDNADRMKAIAQVFPVLFFLVAALISLTTMTRMVEEQRIQIGTMKALGYGKSAIIGKYMGYALCATLGGSILGVLVGEKLFPFVIVTAYKIMYANLPHVMVPYHLSYALMATAAALVCTLGATWFACAQELKAQPAVLMRPPAPPLGKRVLIERVGFIWRRLTFIWKSTIRNLFRYKKRFLMTIFGIGGCMALMIVGFGVKDSIFEVAETQYKELEHADATVYLDDNLSDEVKRDLYDYINEQSEVDKTASMAISSVTLKAEDDSGEVYLYVPEDLSEVEGFLTLRDRRTKEEWTLPEQGAVLSEKMAKELDIKVGDTVTISDDDLEEKEVKIVRICENYMGHRLYMSPQQYEELYDQEAYQNGILFKLKQDDVEIAEDIGEAALTQEGAVNVQYVDNIQTQLDDMLSSLNLVVFVLIISAGMLAFVVLYNLNNINITERRRELATIKVLGFYDGEVSAYVFRENILLTIIGVLVGLVLGKFLHQFVIVTVEIDSFMFGRVVKLASYIYSVLWTIGFSVCVNFIMYFKLKKIDMIESLKSVE